MRWLESMAICPFAGGMWRQTQQYFDMRDMVEMPYFVG